MTASKAAFEAADKAYGAFLSEVDVNSPIGALSAAIDAALAVETVGDAKLMQEAWGALNFILAFYEPGQTHLDTEAWKQAEAGGRRVHAKLRDRLDSEAQAPAQFTFAIKEAREAVSFFDRVKMSSDAEKIAVGQDHWNRMEAALRAVAALPV